MYGEANYSESDFSSVSATENILCDIQRTSSSNMGFWSQYEEYSAARLRQTGPPPPGGGGGGPPPTDGSGGSGGSTGGSSE